jgi:hypothetical protein
MLQVSPAELTQTDKFVIHATQQGEAAQFRFWGTNSNQGRQWASEYTMLCALRALNFHAGRGSTPGAKGVTKRLDKFVQVSTPLPVKPIAIQYPWVFSNHPPTTDRQTECRSVGKRTWLGRVKYVVLQRPQQKWYQKTLFCFLLASSDGKRLSSQYVA